MRIPGFFAGFVCTLVLVAGCTTRSESPKAPTPSDSSNQAPSAAEKYVWTGIALPFSRTLFPCLSRKGKAYEYTLKVQSRKGKVKYEVSGGPDGMSISLEGKLTWHVPAEFEGDEVTPIVLVKDASGQEVFHTFTIHLR